MVFGLGGLERRLNGALHIANRVSDIGNSNPFMSRRDILKLGGATGAGTLLAACGDEGGITNPDTTPPTGDFTYNPLKPLEGQEVYFTANFHDDNGPLKYAWDFGDGSTSPKKDPMHIYEKHGVYPATVRVTDKANNTTPVTKNVQVEKLLTNVTINPRSFFGEGIEGLPIEPLIKSKGTLVLEKDGRTERIDLEGARTLRLMPGEYKVKYEHTDYHDPWALMRQQGSDTNLSQSDLTNTWMTLNVGLEDKVLDLYKIHKDFPLIPKGPEPLPSYFDIIFDNRHEPGITRWKPGLPLDIYIDTRAEAGGSGRKPSQQWVDAIKQAAELLKQIVTIGGKRPFENLNVYVRDDRNIPPARGTYGTVVVYADDDSLNDGGNHTYRDENGYIVAAEMHLRSWYTAVSSALHELALIVADATSYSSSSISVDRTVYSRNSPTPNWMPVDLKANKLVYSFNQGTRFFKTNQTAHLYNPRTILKAA